MENNKFIAQDKKAPIEEVREIENQEQKKDESKGSKVIEKLEETILPTVHASDDGLELNEADKRNKKNAEETIGGGLTASYANPAFGAAWTGATGAAGGVAGLVGEFTGNEELKMTGSIYKESAKKPIENVGRVFDKIDEGIKKIFE